MEYLVNFYDANIKVSETINLSDVEFDVEEISNSIYVENEITTFYDVENIIISKAVGQISNWYFETTGSSHLVIGYEELVVSFTDSLGNEIDKDSYLMSNEEIIYNSFEAKISPNLNISSEDQEVIFTNSQVLSIEIPSENFIFDRDEVLIPHVRILLFLIIFVIFSSLGVIFLINLIIRRKKEKEIE